MLLKVIILPFLNFLFIDVFSYPFNKLKEYREIYRFWYILNKFLKSKIENAKFEGKLIQFLLRVDFLYNLSLFFRGNWILIAFFSFHLNEWRKYRKLWHICGLINIFLWMNWEFNYIMVVFIIILYYLIFVNFLHFCFFI